MNSVEATGKTVEEAIEAGLKILGVEKDCVNVEILEEPSRGLFGIIGTRQARVKLKLKLDAKQLAEEFIKDVCSKMGLDVSVQHEKRGEYHYFYINGRNLGILIGRRGETLDALQYLVNLVVNKRLSKVGNRAKIILDAEGYRKKREKTLIRLAKKLSEKVKRTGTKIVLEPMNPQERRIIHSALQGDEKIQTYSEGVEPYRKVVIAPRNNERSAQ
ncbi:MAG TPA: protein jag [Peptococcaceae bacterium]|nr:MAG: Putative RNA-binding protein [Clostridia bacterium 41_269]HBT19796.1 protein jag [Peptococcaceae bacterium]